jgi:hypothetical protein
MSVNPPSPVPKPRLGATRVIEAVGSAILVGVTGYGSEAIDLLHQL